MGKLLSLGRPRVKICKSKTLNHCERELKLNAAYFRKKSTSQDGFDEICKLCRRQVDKKYRAMESQNKPAFTYKFNGWNGLDEIYNF